MKTEEKTLTKFPYTMGLNAEWKKTFIEQLGAKAINEHQLVLPEDIAEGCSYFTEVMPGLMVLILDFVFHINIEFIRLATQDEFCLVYYDISEEISLHQVNNAKHKVGYNSKLGMAFIDNSLRSSYIPAISQRMYSVRLLISKELIKKHLDPNSTALNEKAFNRKKNTIFFYTHIDSRTRLALLKIRERDYTNPSYGLALKGAVLEAFGLLIERLDETGPTVAKISENDITLVMQTQEYLMNQLFEAFPGMDFLAEMAGMSVSKYKKIFKKLFKKSPNTFFLQEKFLLARELLRSKKYSAINEIAYELGYNKPGYFSTVYKKNFGVLPSQDFCAGNESENVA